MLEQDSETMMVKGNMHERGLPDAMITETH